MEDQRKYTKFGWLDLIRSVWFFLEGTRVSFVFWTILLFIGFFYYLVPPFIVGKLVDFFTKYHAGESLNTFFICVMLS